MSLHSSACRALAERARECTGARTDDKGCFSRIQDSFLPNINSRIIMNDYRKGSGRETIRKLRAAHSSAMLAVNTFGPFRADASQLKIGGYGAFKSMGFEVKCPTGLQGPPPHLDALLRSGDRVVGIESRMLEILNQKKPRFNQSYFKHYPQAGKDPWVNAMYGYNQIKNMHFDVSQVIKHGLSMRKSFGGMAVTLLYIFWEPVNWQSHPEYITHRSEVQAFARSVSGSDLEFLYCSYSELWEDWKGIPGMEKHIENLKKRYELAL